jgi:MtN3 and saliva related transmembrane protein
MTAWLGLISTVCFTISYLPQLIRTYRTRTVEGVSTAYWIIVVAGYVTGCFYVLPMRDLFLTVTYVAGLVSAGAMLAGCLLFRRRGQGAA